MNQRETPKGNLVGYLADHELKESMNWVVVHDTARICMVEGEFS